MFYTHTDSPVGRLLLAGDEEGLRLICFPTETKARTLETGWRRNAEAFKTTIQQLQAYFAGELTEFSLNIVPRGTSFQLLVWTALQQIPYGETISYGELARTIGRPTASRAVGAANGSNPLPIVVPCHRVIGSTGKLTGFGGGLDIKAALLALERNVCNTEGEQMTFTYRF
jgi:methylated-DNA-[protein]-cysteine S-methyltransferase